MASAKTFEDLDLSKEELKRIETALKDEKFRKMFIEYAEEISNPENRKRYEEEIAMLENERGMDIQFVNPEPGHVLKTTSNDGKKAFINICKSDKIGKPTSKKHKNEEGKRGLNWQIPHSFAPPREDFDKAKETCMVYDVVFHPDTYRMTNNLNFLKLVEDTALDGVERQFDVKLDRNNIRRPKMKCKGKPVATVIRNRKDGAVDQSSSKDSEDVLSSMPYPYSDKTSAELAEEKNKQSEERAKAALTKESKTKSNILKKEEDGYTEPKYTITHRSDMDLQEYRNAPDARPTTRPKELVINIELPLCKSAAGVDLDIFEDKLSLKSEKPAYKLDLKLPYVVDDENGSARFDKSKKSLVVTLPVIPGEIPSMPSFIDKEDKQEIPSLIEELPPLENLNGNAENVPSDLPPLEEIDGVDDVKESKADMSPRESESIPYTMPEYDFNQDQETMTFVFHVKNVSEESVSRAFPYPGDFEIKFVSVGSGGFPMHYRFYGRFGEGNKLVPEHCTVDVSDRNMTFTILKQRENRTLWNKFFAGACKDSLEEKLFVTSDNLQEELDKLQLEGENMGQTDEHAPEAHSANIKVTEMNEKKLTLKIRKPATSFSEEEEDVYHEDESPTSAAIEVVHSKKPPNLHGILKQRSMSESSEDHLSLSSGESPTGCSPRDSDSSSGKRSVTFNSHIDKTTFKKNAAASSIRQALKGKRRRLKKKEEKKKEREGRRRHNSLGSECSSCDDEHDSRRSSESHSEDDPEIEDLTQQLEETGMKVEGCGVIEEDQEEQEDKAEEEGEEADDKPNESDASKMPGYQIHSESVKKASKLAAEVKSKLEEMRKDVIENDSDDDIGVVVDDRTVIVKSEKANMMTRDENQQKVVDMTSGESEKVENEENDLSVVENGIKSSKAANQDSGEINPKSDTKSAMKSSNPGKNSQKGVKFKDDVKESESSEKGDGDKKGGGQESQENIVETELSWKDTKKTDPFNEHRTQCAFDFANSVMYDLDID